MDSDADIKKPGARPSYLGFDKASYPRKQGVDYRARSKLYRVGKGEQGILICEPYKSELTPHWRFKTPVEARRSARKIYAMFKSNLEEEDFVGVDMARKFLQMGYTRARRYANYKGGSKYDKANGYALKERGTGDPQKAEARRSSTSFGEKRKPNGVMRRKKQIGKAATDEAAGPSRLLLSRSFPGDAGFRRQEVWLDPDGRAPDVCQSVPRAFKGCAVPVDPHGQPPRRDLQPARFQVCRDRRPSAGA
jgi:Domain of unknown function (DUF4385)